MDKIKLKLKPNLISKKHLIIIAIMLLFTVLAINFNNSFNNRTLARKDILIATVQQGDIDISIDGYGTLKSANMQLLTALTKATVKQIRLKPGALVTKNSIIVFRRVWFHIIFTNNFSNPGFLSKRQSHIQRDKKRCIFRENRFSC